MNQNPTCCAIVPNLGVVPITLSAMLALDRISAALLRDLDAVTAELRRGAKFDLLFVDVDVLGGAPEVSIALARLRRNYPEIAVIVLSGGIEDAFRPPIEAGYDVALQIPVSEAALDLARIQARVNRSLRRFPTAPGGAEAKLVVSHPKVTGVH
ncbi:response regulator [Rhodobacter maris]|uniref:Response regulator receiver domain-containing protein n=1 Tax=Rhodobacter maris TaxID=446682 RepID=A0A285TGW1_9RHOB|nr:response regulator [Rhodobacter maris]SOC21282.1 hypothetical protein SAMN05877831_12217 [Rhodobacter maris]